MLRSLKNWWLTRQQERRHRGPRRTFQPRLEAFEERWMPSAFVVTDAVDSAQVHVGTNNPADNNGLVSLRSAVAAAEVDSANGKSDAITFSNKLMKDQFTELTLGSIDLTAGSGTVTIQGSRGYALGNLLDSVFVSSSGSNTVIEDITVRGGNSDYGGACFNNGTIKFSLCSFDFDNASDSGGALDNQEGATMTVSDCVFSNNQAALYGGAICNVGNLTVNNGSQFINNTAQDDGGAIVNFDGLVKVVNTTFTTNTAARNGGAIASEVFPFLSSAPQLILNTCAFDGNVAADDGGAIYLYLNDSISNTKPTYSGNTAQSRR